MKDLRTLGALELRSSDGRSLSRRRKELSLLAYLALRSPRPFTRDELVALFWDGPDLDRGRHSLRQALSSLRRQVGSGLEVDPLVRLREDVLDVDGVRFATLAVAGEARSALALWSGDLMEGAEDGSGPDFRLWLEGERERLRGLRARCFEALADEAELRGDWTGLAACCRGYAEAFPYLERAHARLVEALLLGGRIEEATHAHAGYLARSAELGGAEPSADFLALASRLREPSLAVPRDRPSTGEPLPWSEAFEVVLAHWSDVLEGKGSSVWVTGSAGSGKSRIIDDFLRWLAVRSPETLVLRAPGAEPAGARGAGALFDPLRRAPGLGASSEGALALAAEVMPFLRERFPTLPLPPPGAQADAQAVGGALREVLEGISGEVPVVVAVDAPSLLDPWSGRVVAHLAAHPPDGVLILCSASSHSAPSEEGWQVPSDGAEVLRLSPSPAPVPPPRRTLPGRLLVAGAVAATLVAVWLLASLRPGRGSGAAARIVAVGEIRVSGLSDSLRGFPELLGANLARIEDIQVLSGGALLALAPPARPGGSHAPDLAEAARRGGATQLVQGSLSRRSDGHLRLDLTRTEVASGRILRAYAVEAEEAFDLVDLAVERVARDLGVSSATLRPTGGHASLAAYRFFEEGLRAYYRRDVSGARTLFVTALAEDSAFAMAAYYLSLVSDTPERWELLARAARLAGGGTERERLLIESEYATYMGDPARLAKADTLVSRYPFEPTGRLLLGSALILEGDFLPALRHLRWVVAYDSASLSGQLPRCLACEALDRMAEALYFADSTRVAERVARDWVTLQPRSPAAWFRLSNTLEALDRYDEALQALDSAAVLQPLDPSLTARRTSILIRRGEYDKANRLDEARLLAGGRAEREAALWGLAIGYRQQRRLAEALDAARGFRALASLPPAPPEAWIHEAVPEATVLFDQGRFEEAAALYDSIAATPPTGASEARIGRSRAWSLTHAAAAYAALGDTARLRALEDTIRVEGGKSAYRRDQRLHHHIRGLHLQLEGRWDEAAAAFREALYSPVEGYGRTGLELGRSLTRAGRPQEAVAALRSALRGPIGASGLYVTRPEFQAAMAEAFDAAGRPDSAGVYQARVRAAWARSDAPAAGAAEGPAGPTPAARPPGTGR